MSEGGNKPTSNLPEPTLNEHQQRRLRVTCEHIDKMLSEVEEILNVASSKAAFPKYSLDISPVQRRTIEDYIARIRAQLVRVLDGQGICSERNLISSRHAIYTSLIFVDIVIEELKPKYMRGYGEVPDSVARELNGIVGELEGLVVRLNRFLGAGPDESFKSRLQRLEQTRGEMQLLTKIEEVVAELGLVEFRPTIEAILDRAEEKTFEIAVFGRVSSGKSSLLNAILGTEVLPVGVTPITAVPTRIRSGNSPRAIVSIAERPAIGVEISRVAEFATEQQNPGNAKHVTRIVLELPAERLKDGVTFVDTPGLGSLATTGAAETLAYLPRCDLGVVLIDAGSTLTPDDLQTIQTLQEATIPVTILLSKADLLAASEIERVVQYVGQHIASDCRLETAVHPVSVLESHRYLLDRWFGEDILPLFARSQELKAASLRRKIGALRESIILALRSRLRLTDKQRTLAEPRVRGVEAQLRQATGKLEETRTESEKDLDNVARASSFLIGEVACQLVAKWDLNGSPEPAVREEILIVVEGWVQSLRKRLESLAAELFETLVASAEALDFPDVPAKEEFESLVRGIPPFDLGNISVRVRRPTLRKLLGGGFAARRVASQIAGQCRSELDQALQVYSRVWSDWLTSMFKLLGGRFDSYADRYRAQAERSLPTKKLSRDDENVILAALAKLGAFEVVTEGTIPIAGRNETQGAQDQTSAVLQKGASPRTT